MLTVGKEESLVSFAKQIGTELRANVIRLEANSSSNKINGNMQDAGTAEVHTSLVIDPRDKEPGKVAARRNGWSDMGAKPKAEVFEEILAAISECR